MIVFVLYILSLGAVPFVVSNMNKNIQDKQKQFLILSPKPPPDNYITYHTLQNQLASFALFFKCVF